MTSYHFVQRLTDVKRAVERVLIFHRRRVISTQEIGVVRIRDVGAFGRHVGFRVAIRCVGGACLDMFASASDEIRLTEKKKETHISHAEKKRTQKLKKATTLSPPVEQASYIPKTMQHGEKRKDEQNTCKLIEENCPTLFRPDVGYQKTITP